ncbi:MAG: hypothetical protein GPJ00_03000 [Microcystis aeruginosa W13-18]|nr:hypothetical protein [Microcystis aeruginosa W13-18]
MSNETVTYSLEAILTRIEGKIDKIDERLTKVETAQIGRGNPKKSGLDIDYPFGKCHFYGRLESIFFK